MISDTQLSLILRDPVWNVVKKRSGVPASQGTRRALAEWLHDERESVVPWDDDDLADKVIEKIKDLPRTRRPPRLDPAQKATLDQVDVDRWQATSLRVAELASNDRDALHFRREVLGGHVFGTIAAAAEWIQSRAGDQGPVSARYEVVIDDPEVAAAIDDEFDFSGKVNIRRPERVPPLVLRYVADDNGRVERVEVADRGDNPLLGLRRVGETMTKRYAWEPEQAVTWLLTGLVPPLPLITAKTGGAPRSPARLVLDIDPELPPHLVERVYRKERTKLLKGGHRLTGRGAAAVLCYLTTPKLSWANRLRKWNAEHGPDERYQSPQAMAATVNQTLKRIDRLLRPVRQDPE